MVAQRLVDQHQRDDERGDEQCGHLEALRVKEGGDHEDHQHDGADQTYGVDGTHSRSTAFTTSPKTTKTAIVRATKMTSAIPTPRIRFLRCGPPDGRPHMTANRRILGFWRFLTGFIRLPPEY
ncbi:hypothetical protein GCM10010149_68840 [Nonomuraea roseoviolacea subsp. roseoviolacea]